MALLTRRTLPELEAKLGEWVQVDLMSESDASFAIPGLEIIDNSDWQTLIPQDPALAERLRSVVHESAVNARRHGHGSVMNVHLMRSGSQLILTCSDNGSGPNPDSIPGLGSALLDEVSLTHSGSWSLKREHGQTVMRMEIPVGAGDIPD
jgi:two-component sensor histidine kinase